MMGAYFYGGPLKVPWPLGLALTDRTLTCPAPVQSGMMETFRLNGATLWQGCAFVAAWRRHGQPAHVSEKHRRNGKRQCSKDNACLLAPHQRDEQGETNIF